MLRAGRRSASVLHRPSLDDAASDPLVMSAEQFMRLPIVVIEGWPDDQVAIVSPKLAAVIRAALAEAARIARRDV
jgi:hypothetical protein